MWEALTDTATYINLVMSSLSCYTSLDLEMFKSIEYHKLESESEISLRYDFPKLMNHRLDHLLWTLCMHVSIRWIYVHM
jgi:hypothetical protein